MENQGENSVTRRVKPMTQEYAQLRPHIRPMPVAWQLTILHLMASSNPSTTVKSQLRDRLARLRVLAPELAELLEVRS